MRALTGGNAFVGRGSALRISEFPRDGGLLFDARFPSEVESYTAFRPPWKGLPKDRPAVAAESEPECRVTLIRQLERGHGDRRLGGARRPRPWVPPFRKFRKGFETASAFRTDEPYVATRA